MLKALGFNKALQEGKKKKKSGNSFCLQTFIWGHADKRNSSH
jgi:hypothetical protein